MICRCCSFLSSEPIWMCPQEALQHSQQSEFQCLGCNSFHSTFRGSNFWPDNQTEPNRTRLVQNISKPQQQRPSTSRGWGSLLAEHETLMKVYQRDSDKKKQQLWPYDQVAGLFWGILDLNVFEVLGWQVWSNKENCVLNMIRGDKPLNADSKIKSAAHSRGQA